MVNKLVIRWLNSIMLAVFLLSDGVAQAALQRAVRGGERSKDTLAPQTFFSGKRDAVSLLKKAQADIAAERKKTGGEGIPVRRITPVSDIDLASVDVVSGTVNTKGELAIEKEHVEGFWDDKKRNLVRKLYRLLMRSAAVPSGSVLGHRKLLRDMAQFKIVDRSNNLMRVYRDDRGMYEIIIDRTLFDLTGVDIFPFMALALQHEFNHPQLHAELSDKPYDPLVVEMSALLANLDMYRGMSSSREKVKQVLRMLPAHGFDPQPFSDFLETEKLGARERVDAAYKLATDSRMNPEIHARINEIESLRVRKILDETHVDFARALKNHDYAAFPADPQNITAYGDALQEVFKEPIEELRDYIIPKLFKFFDLDVLKPLGTLNRELERRIIGEILPSLVNIGGLRVRKHLEKIVATTDYSMDLRCKAAEALLDISFYRAMPVIRNPFFGKEVIAYLQQLRGNKRFWDLSNEMTGDIIFKIWLLGNIEVEDAELYRKIRSEITWWALNTRNIMNEFTSAQKLHPDHQVTAAQYHNAQRLYGMANAARKQARYNLNSYLGFASVPKKDWKRLNRYVYSEHDPMNPALPEDAPERRFKGDAELLRRVILKTMEDSLFVRESIFVISDVYLDEGDVKAVTVQYFAMGTQKMVYLVTVETSRGDHRFLLNAVRPAKLRGSQDGADRAEADADFEKLCLALLGKPYVENLGGEWSTDRMILWSEELIHGDLMEDFIKKHEHMPLPHFISFWKDLVRKHAQLQCDLYALSSGQFLNRDANAFNSIWDADGEGRIIDIGTTMYTPDLNEFFLIFTRGTFEIESGFPALVGTAEIGDICDGVLDAFGEIEGKARLGDFARYSPAMTRIGYVDGIEDFVGSSNASAGYTKYVFDDRNDMLTVRGRVTPDEADALTALYEDKELIRSKIKWLAGYFKLDTGPYAGVDLRDAVDEYLRTRALSFIPRQAQTEPTSLEKKIARKIAGNDYEAIVNVVVYNRRRLFALNDSPWIWLYLNVRYWEQRAKDKPFTRAVRELYDEARRNPAILEESGRAAAEAKMAEIASRHRLSDPLIQFLKVTLSYRDAMRQHAARLFESWLQNGGYSVAEYRAEVDELSGIFSRIVVDPADAAVQLQKAVVNPKLQDILRSLPFMLNPDLTEGMLPMVQTVKTFQDLEFIAPEQAMAFYRNIPLKELTKFIQFGNPDVLRMLINVDYKLFADSVNDLYDKSMSKEGQPSPLVPVFSIELFSPGNKVTLLESAHILNEIDKQVIKEMIYAITTAKNYDDRKQTIWRAWCDFRAREPQDYARIVFTRVPAALTYLGRIDAEKAIAVAAEIIDEIRPDAARGTSFLGNAGEVVSGTGWRYDDLIKTLGLLPRNILLSALWRVYKKDPGKVALFLDMLKLAGHNRIYNDVARKLDSDERLRQFFEERQRRTIDSELLSIGSMEEAA